MANFGTSNMGGAHGMRAADAPSRGAGRAASADLTAKRPKPKLKDIWPEIWALVKPRLPLLIGCFFLMAINRASGLVLPALFQPLIDKVMRQDQISLLPKIVGCVLGATLLQGITSYSLTQLLSKSGQRLITDLRMQVQQHVGRLSVSFYDENRTGTLVARIMSDVEGVRNLVGTGVVDFVGGVLTAIFAFAWLLHISAKMTLLTFVILLVFAVILQKAFKTIRPIFRERAKINAEVTGRLTESLGGVRVVKGYHAEESEARVFAGGVERLLQNVISSLTAQSLMSLASTVVLGVVSALVMYLGANQHHAHRLHHRRDRLLVADRRDFWHCGNPCPPIDLRLIHAVFCERAGQPGDFRILGRGREWRGVVDHPHHSLPGSANAAHGGSEYPLRHVLRLQQQRVGPAGVRAGHDYERLRHRFRHPGAGGHDHSTARIHGGIRSLRMSRQLQHGHQLPRPAVLRRSQPGKPADSV